MCTNNSVILVLKLYCPGNEGIEALYSGSAAEIL